jgi:hypothetical protein
MLICPLLARSRTSRPQHATNARTIYTVLKLDEILFDVMPAWKHGCMFVGALHFSRTLLLRGPLQLLGFPDSGTETNYRLLHDCTPLS